MNLLKFLCLLARFVTAARPLWRIVDIILRKETHAAISKMAIIRLKSISSLTVIRIRWYYEIEPRTRSMRENEKGKNIDERIYRIYTRAHVYFTSFIFRLSPFTFHFSFFIFRFSFFIFHFSKAPVILVGYFSRFTEKPVLSRKSLADASQIYSSHLRFPPRARWLVVRAGNLWGTTNELCRISCDHWNVRSRPRTFSISPCT